METGPDHALNKPASPGNTMIRYRLFCLAALLGLVALGLFGLVHALPGAVYNPDWILGENGNQLFRAEQLHTGKQLYKDIDCQYGPLPIWGWYGFSLIAGNTITGNVIFQSLLNLILIGCLFWWATKCTDNRRDITLITLLIGLLAFARTPYLHLLASPNANFEYFTFERLCLLGFIFSWRPSTERTGRLGNVIALLFLLWQCSKVGGAIIGVAAYLATDLIWLGVSGHRNELSTLTRWWMVTLGKIAALEAIRCGLFVALFGSEQGWRSAWPLYVALEYQRTWLTLWAGPKHFLTVVLPIVGLLALLPWFILRTIQKSRLITPSPMENTFWYQSIVGACFYLLGAIPIVGYFGHEWHFFQYQWALLPIGLALVRYRPTTGFALMIPLHFLSLYLAVGDILRAPPADKLERVETSIGPIIAQGDDAQLKLIDEGLKLARLSFEGHSLIIGTWGGGGWYVANGETQTPHNIFFSNRSIRRDSDNDEFAHLLTKANLIIAMKRDALGPEWLGKLAGPICEKELEEHFEPIPSNAQSGWMIFRRKAAIQP